MEDSLLDGEDGDDSDLTAGPDQFYENLSFFDENCRLILERNQFELNEVQDFFQKLANHHLKSKKHQILRNFYTLLCLQSETI